MTAPGPRPPQGASGDDPPPPWPAPGPALPAGSEGSEGSEGGGERRWWPGLRPAPFPPGERASGPAHLSPVPAPPKARWGRRPGTVRSLERQRQLVVIGLVVLVTLGATLAGVGWRRVRETTPGRYVDPSLQPDEAGYVALVTPTPTSLVIHRGGDGALAGVALLALRSQDEGGSVIVMPVATRAPAGGDDVSGSGAGGEGGGEGGTGGGDDGGGEGAGAGRTLAEAYADGGAEAVGQAVERVLDVAVRTPVELDDADWASLVRPVDPLPVEVDQAVAYWPSGEVALPAGEVGAFLGARDEDESELDRLARQERFWQAWIDALATGGRDAVPGEGDVGLGRFLRGLARGPVTVVSLPVAEEPGAGGEELVADPALVAALVASEVPYPQEPAPGSRTRVRLLNGTRDDEVSLWAVAPLVEAGAEIALAGNAPSFGRPRTRIVYSREELRDEAVALREALGIGAVEASATAGEETTLPGEESERVDVTVILGADALDTIRRSESPE